MSEPIERVIWVTRRQMGAMGIVAVPGVGSLFWWHGRRRGIVGGFFPERAAGSQAPMVYPRL